MNLHKLYALAFGFVFLIHSLAGQNCYVQLDDASGFDTSPYQQELENAACELVQAFPPEFQNQFKVYDFGFYLHQEHYQGGFPQVFLDKVAEVEQLSPYFLLFGKQTDGSGVYTRIWVEVRLPESGMFDCLDSEKMAGILAELDLILHDNYSPPNGFAEKEMEVMSRLSSFIEQLKICCFFSPGFRISGSDLDSSLLEIKVCIDNNCQEEVEGVVAVISPGPNMPEIAFTLEYYGDTICVDLNAVLEIRYERSPPSAPSRARNDNAEFMIANVNIGFPYTFDYEEVGLWGENWATIQGGRAELIIYDIFGEYIKSFKFTVKGQNPKVGEVFDHLDQAPYGEIWFLKKLFMHESATRPTNDLGTEMFQFNFLSEEHENLEEDWNAWSRCPNMSFDGGWGLGQLTNPVPDKLSLWDWKANIHECYHRLAEETLTEEPETRYAFIKRKIGDYMDIILDWESENPGFEVEGHEAFQHGGITWVHGMSTLFEQVNDIDGFQDHFDVELEEGEHSFLDAMVLKAYNGIGTVGSPHYDQNFYYIFYDEGNPSQIPEWRIDVDAHYGNSVNFYVESVAEQEIPNH
ncbi:MAG: hypothetical protein H6559_29620 [Lewinellaceae bacterium]|nr:hypothetical protein [Lewinellaceae bacterium]